MRNPLFADIKPSFIATRMSVGSAHFTSNHRLMVPVHKIQSSFTICVEETVNNICVTRRYTQNWMTRMNAYTNLRVVLLSLFYPLRNKTCLHSLIPTPGGNKCCRITYRYKADYISGFRLWTQFVFESDAPDRLRYINWLNFLGVLELVVGPIIWVQGEYLVQVGLGWGLILRRRGVLTSPNDWLPKHINPLKLIAIISIKHFFSTKMMWPTRRPKTSMNFTQITPRGIPTAPGIFYIRLYIYRYYSFYLHQ